jgi:hypothetical protein
MPCTHPDFRSAGEYCNRATLPDSPFCWRHDPRTAPARSLAATKAARTRRRRRSWWARLLAALTFRRPALTPSKES